jgi:hypothetical protein
LYGQQPNTALVKKFTLIFDFSVERMILIVCFRSNILFFPTYFCNQLGSSSKVENSRSIASGLSSSLPVELK